MSEDVVEINTKERTERKVESRTTFIHAGPAKQDPGSGDVRHGLFSGNGTPSSCDLGAKLFYRVSFKAAVPVHGFSFRLRVSL